MIRLHNSDNGLRIGLERVETVQTVSIGVWVKTGSRWETLENNGIAHLIEHMVFKGTVRRSAQVIMEEIEEKGGSLNAFTSREYTCFYGKVLKEDQQLLLDILSDMVFFSTFTQDNIDREKMVVLEEIAMYEDTPDDAVHDLLLEEMFAHHPLGRNILGTANRISSMTQEQIVSFHQEHYQPHKMVVSVAGNILEEEIISQIEHYFMLHRQREKNNDSMQPIGKIGKGFIYQAKKVEQSHLCLGIQSPHKEDDEYFSLVMLNSILGGSGSSRLFQEIREKRGLAYSIYSYNQSFSDVGVFSIYAGTSHQSVNQVLDLVVRMLEDVKNGGLNQKEYNRTKNQLRAHIVMGNESISSKMKRIGSNLMEQDRIVEEEEILQKLEAVSFENMEELAQKLCDPSSYAMAVIGVERNKKSVMTWWQELKGTIHEAL